MRPVILNFSFIFIDFGIQEHFVVYFQDLKAIAVITT